MSDVAELTAPLWRADTLEAAKKLIYDPSAWEGVDGNSWERRTADVMPVLLNSFVVKSLIKTDVAVEIGCGVGRLLRPMAERFAVVVGVDVSPTMVEFSKAYLAGVENASAKLCDGETIPLPGKFADFIYSMIAFQHIPYRSVVQNYLREAFRVLRPGGVVRAQTCRGAGVDTFNGGTQGYGYLSSADFASDFLSAGLKVEEVEAGVWHQEHLWVTARRPE